jgi:hypothetical protein
MPYSLSTAALKPKVMAPGANKLLGIDMKGIFPAGGLILTPSVTCVTAVQSGANGATGVVSTGDLVIAGPLINTSAFVNDDNRTVQIGEAVQVRISGGVDGGNYTLAVTVSDGSNTDTLYCLLQVRKTPPT